MNFALTLALAFLSLPAFAHVKWFATNTDQGAMITSFSQLNYPSFWFLLSLSVVTIALLVYLDRKLESWSPYSRLNKLLASYSHEAEVYLRVFAGAALLLAWADDTIIAPELKVSEFVGWWEFWLVILLLTRTTAWIAGLGMMALYFYAILHFGFFHLLDYLVYATVAYFFIVGAPFLKKNKAIYASRIPALYVGLGFSLCWAALEKIVFPHWGLDVLSQRPELTFGLNHEFFLLACAFIELSLGYLLIVGILQRPLALTITVVFVLTTMVFGKTEVIGHTILHGALLVFVLVGQGGYFNPPIKIHRSTAMRAIFAGVNFVVVTGLLGFAYLKMSSH